MSQKGGPADGVDLHSLTNDLNVDFDPLVPRKKSFTLRNWKGVTRRTILCPCLHVHIRRVHSCHSPYWGCSWSPELENQKTFKKNNQSVTLGSRTTKFQISSLSSARIQRISCTGNLLKVDLHQIAPNCTRQMPYYCAIMVTFASGLDMLTHGARQICQHHLKSYEPQKHVRLSVKTWSHWKRMSSHMS